MVYLCVAVGLVQGVLDGALGHAAGCVSSIAQHPEGRGCHMPGPLQEGGSGPLQTQACATTAAVFECMVSSWRFLGGGQPSS